MATKISSLKKKSAQKAQPSKTEPEKAEATEKKAEVSDKTAQTSGSSEGAVKQSGTTKPWWMAGSQVKEAAQQEYDKNRRKPFRFWLKEDETREIILVDGITEGVSDEGFAFWEHAFRLGASWKTMTEETCLLGVDDRGCPYCQHFPRGHRYLVTLRTIIDLTPYTTKDGETREWSRRIFAAKPTTNKKLELKRKQKGSLTGWRVQVTRTEAKAARCGDDFEFVDQVDLSEFKYKDPQTNKMLSVAEYDYRKIFEPLDYPSAKGIIQSISGDVDESQQGDMDAEIPF